MSNSSDCFPKAALMGRNIETAYAEAEYVGKGNVIGGNVERTEV